MPSPRALCSLAVANSNLSKKLSLSGVRVWSWPPLAVDVFAIVRRSTSALYFPLHFEKASVLVEKLVCHQADLINVAVSFLLSELFLLELPSNSFQ